VAPNIAGMHLDQILFSKPESLITYGLSTRFGGYYANGSRYNIVADLGYRFQPYVSMAINVSYNNIRFTCPMEPYKILAYWPEDRCNYDQQIVLHHFCTIQRAT